MLSGDVKLIQRKESNKTGIRSWLFFVTREEVAVKKTKNSNSIRCQYIDYIRVKGVVTCNLYDKRLDKLVFTVEKYCFYDVGY